MNSFAPLADNSIGALLVRQKHDEIGLAHRFDLGRFLTVSRRTLPVERSKLSDN
jgi:hypothetical protein